MNYDTLGDWCKWLEKNFSNEVMIPKLPVIIRFDGNNFSKFTKGLDRPFDSNFRELMLETTKFLVEETNALIGYTHSDEITLLLYSDDRKSSIYHSGKKQKILSKLTAKCTQFFNEKRKEILPNHNKLAIFDARIYQTPTKKDAVAQILWRELDATRNSKLMLAYSNYSHNEVMNKKTNELQDMLMLEKNINWNDLEVWKKRGTYVRRTEVIRAFTKSELDKLPLKHNARKNPNLEIKRKEFNVIELPILNTISNRVEVFFNGEEPVLIKD